MTSRAFSRDAVRRIACAVVANELVRLRGTESQASAGAPWSDAMPIGDEGLELDSLEQLGALGALSETFGLGDTLPIERSTVGHWVDWIAASQSEGAGRITVHTSGSTGSPRLCLHAAADLLGEADHLATLFSDRARIVALVPAHHIYGMIWTALLPAALGVPVVARSVGEPLELTDGDLVVGVPEQWQALLRLTRRFPDGVAGVTSGGPIDDGVANGLLAAGLTRLSDIYGSSETGGIAIRDLPATAYDLLPRWQLGGELDWHLVDGSGRVAALPDHVERVGDRAVRPLRRRDGSVQVGGQNVWPNRVAEVLREIDGVVDAAVRLHVDGRLKAFIVPDAKRPSDDVRSAVQRAVAACLTVPERPKELRFGPALPRNAMGKLEDWA